MQNLTYTLQVANVTQTTRPLTFAEMKRVAKMGLKTGSTALVVDSLGSKCSIKKWLELAKMYDELAKM